MNELINKLQAEALRLEIEGRKLHKMYSHDEALKLLHTASGIYEAIKIVKEDYKKDNPF